ncbi:hypothetical protein M9Y10_009889 [Tritrichomonas musculus]|uniref:Uncharacterized protein n=1 Tax=Tritrichomonas musculus TaxID=1915356 RepID=A0ABR2IPR6_9EUKA
MLSVELQPAVRQIVERNEQLEEENKQLLDKVHELLTEVTALKATRHKFKLDCESAITSGTSSPSRDMKQKIKRQKRQIENLQSQLSSTKTELEATLQEKKLIQQNIEKHEDTLEKQTQDEADATHSCREMVKSLNHLIGMISSPDAENESDSEELNFSNLNDLPTAVSFLQKKIHVLSEKCTELNQFNDNRKLENTNQRQQISSLETQIQCLEKEKETLEECNAKYINEREELGSAIATLRSALTEVKNNLISSDEEKKELKKENIRLRIELDALKENKKTEFGGIDDENDDNY